MAAAVVIGVYLVAVVAFDALVVHRLTAEADARLSAELVRASAPTFTLPGTSVGNDHDDDDAPVFLWSVSPAGVPTAESPSAPTLPTRSWTDGGPRTIEVGGTSFRVQARSTATGWLVTGQSGAQIDRVRGALVLPEVLLGVALLAVAFGGALVIGLRASAPLELIHRRQVEFTADASHELRTPLSVIEAEVALALSRPRTPAEHEAVLRRIADEGTRLHRIVEDLLWLARADDTAEHPDRTPTTTEVADIAAGCADRFRPLAAARGVGIRFEPDGRSSSIAADPEWVDRLLGVLVDNACRYAGADGRVDVRVLSSGSRVVLQVDDSGPGIAPDQRTLIFDRFHRATDASGGTGLGLAIADTVVRSSHGAWAVDRSPLGGARMEVSWRRVPSPRSPGGRAGGDGSGPGAAGGDERHRAPVPRPVDAD